MIRSLLLIALISVGTVAFAHEMASGSDKKESKEIELPEHMPSVSTEKKHHKKPHQHQHGNGHDRDGKNGEAHGHDEDNNLVPEPESFWMMGMGLVGLAIVGRRRVLAC